MLLGTLVASLLEDFLMGKGIYRAGKGKGINRAGEGVLRAGYDNNNNNHNKIIIILIIITITIIMIIK